MNNNNLLLAVLLSIGILFGFHYFYEAPRQQALRQQATLSSLAQAPIPAKIVEAAPTLRPRAELVQSGARIKIESPELTGSINLVGARLDDLSLVNYRTTTEEHAPQITLLSPAGSADPDRPAYAEFGWLADQVAVPTATTQWKAVEKTLTPQSPLHLTWDNGAGLVFERTIALDEHFMFTVTDRVRNNGTQAVTLYPFGLLARHGAVLHSSEREGPLGVFDNTLTEINFGDMIKEKHKSMTSDGGWLGLTDKYWLLAMIPNQNQKIAATFTYDQNGAVLPEKGLFQADFRGVPVQVAAGAVAEHSTNFFAGAKRVRVIDTYADRYQIPHFDRAIDFGWFYFLTKPFLFLLDYLGLALGDFGLAILALTILLKLVTYPLSAKSYRSMARMKELQPELLKLQERFKEDKQALGLETMALYKREKVNPMSGCLPILIQMPIFFALYKVLYVSIELRHAPFFGWIKDMSAPDPTSIFTLFGLIPDYALIPHLGVWPLLMGISMYLQQKLSPQPTDPNQARIFLWMPVIFTFMLSSMASGLVIYWTWGNLLGILQQWAMMRHYEGGKK